MSSSLWHLHFLNFGLVLDWFVTSIHFTVVNPMPIIPPRQHFSLLELLRLLALLSTRNLKDLSTTSVVCLLEFYSFILIAVPFILCSRFIFLRLLSSCYVWYHIKNIHCHCLLKRFRIHFSAVHTTEILTSLQNGLKGADFSLF